MQKTLVTFSLTLMLEVRVFFFELIHLDKNLKGIERSNVLVFENARSLYMKEYC